MFKVSLSQLILIYIALPLVILFILWFLKEKKNSEYLDISDNPEEFVLECPFCNNIFMSTIKKEVNNCPLCNNYFKKNDEK